MKVYDKEELLQLFQLLSLYSSSEGKEGRRVFFNDLLIADITLDGLLLFSFEAVGSILQRVSASNVDLYAATLTLARFENCTFDNVIFRKGIFYEVSFVNCHFKGCDFSRSEIIHAVIENCTFDTCDFNGILFIENKVVNSVFEKIKDKSKGVLSRNEEENVTWTDDCT